MIVAVYLGAGCSGNPKLSAPQELDRFEKAGGTWAETDVDRIVSARAPAGPYRVVPGDVIGLDMPVILAALNLDPRGKMDYLSCRVGEDGRIYLPSAGQISVTGKTVAEVESDVVAAYHPRYVLAKPCVIAKVIEYRTHRVSISGGVKEPGIHSLRSDEMTLVALLMKAGGIVSEGARAIRVRHLGDAPSNQKAPPPAIALPVKGMNVPFTDVALQAGDTVDVERLAPQLVTVLGLVNRAGAFPYPADARYTLVQAIALAGGPNDKAEPQFATVYRQDASGKTHRAVFGLDTKAAPSPNSVLVKPGDVISIDQTLVTRTRLFLAEVFRVGTGAYVGATYNLNPTQGQ